MIKSVRFVMSVIPQNIFFNQILMNYGTSLCLPSLLTVRPKSKVAEVEKQSWQCKMLNLALKTLLLYFSNN